MRQLTIRSQRTKILCGVPEIPYKNTAAIFLPHQGGVGCLGLKALATCANADRRKKRAGPFRLRPRATARHGGRGGMKHPGGVRFPNQGLQARAAKSSLARPFMARSYFSSYFWDTTLELVWASSRFAGEAGSTVGVMPCIFAAMHKCKA